MAFAKGTKVAIETTDRQIKDMLRKAKLEAIDAGVETFEDAFLAHIQTDTGETVSQRLKPQLREIVSGNAPLQITGPR